MIFHASIVYQHFINMFMTCCLYWCLCLNYSVVGTPSYVVVKVGHHLLIWFLIRTLERNWELSLNIFTHPLKTTAKFCRFRLGSVGSFQWGARFGNLPIQLMIFSSTPWYVSLLKSVLHDLKVTCIRFNISHVWLSENSKMRVDVFYTRSPSTQQSTVMAMHKSTLTTPRWVNSLRPSYAYSK